MKKMMKFTTVLLTTMIIASSMVGCKKAATTTLPPAAGTAILEVAFAKVKWYVFGAKPADLDMVMTNLNVDLKKKANVELDLQFIDAGTFEDKMKLIVASNEDYDLTFTSNWRNRFVDNMAKEAFQPLDDLLNKYGQDIKKQIPAWLIDVAKVSGKLYAIPNQQFVATQFGLAIQKGLLDKYKFDVTKVKELKDIEPFLKMIKENEPNLIPLKQSQQVIRDIQYEAIASWNAAIKRGDKSLTIVGNIGLQAAIDQSKLNNDWYKNGYLRKDLMTIKDDSADLKANKYAVLLNSYKPGGGAETTAKQGIEYVMIPIAKAFINADSGSSTMTAVNANSKHPEAAMKLLNVVQTDKDIYNKLLFGLENTHYTKTDATHVVPVKDTKYNLGTVGWMLGNNFNAWFLPGQADTVWTESNTINTSSEVSVLRGFNFNPAPIQAEIAQLSAVNTEYSSGEWVTDNLDNFLKEKNDKLKKAGYDKVIAEVQKQVDVWAKANGKK